MHLLSESPRQTVRFAAASPVRAVSLLKFDVCQRCDQIFTRWLGMKGKGRGRKSRQECYFPSERSLQRQGGGRELIAVAEDVRTLSLSAGLRF